MKIAVIVSDATAMIHTGAELHRMVRTFELPREISDYIAAKNKDGSYTTISLAVVDDPSEQEPAND